MRFLKWLLAILLIASAVYFIWASTGRTGSDDIGPANQLNPDSIITIGKNLAKGNLISMQPLLHAANYAGEKQFLEALHPYFQMARDKQLFNEQTVVVLPEYIGSWLVAANEKKSIYQEAHMMDAMKTMVFSNILSYGFTYLNTPKVDNRSTFAVFAMKAPQMAAIYQQVFRQLSNEFHVTIVAGSIVLPEPYIDSQGQLATRKGMLYNTSVIFDPRGNIIAPLVKKIYPIDEEAGFTACAPVDQHPVFNTAAGKLGVLVCADSWYPSAYQSFDSSVRIIAVPSLGGTDDIWQAPWNGYNGFKAPPDVDTTDYHRLSEGQAWEKYTMGKRAVKAGIHYGMNVFFTGRLWDKQSEGRVLMLNRDSLTVFSPAYAGRIINLWLD